MPRIILIRHAKSDWSFDLPDHDRPLNARGRRDAPQIGTWLAEHVNSVDAAFVSSAVRTQETWELLCQSWGQNVPMVTESRIYDAPSRVITELIESLPESISTALVVGHNPGLSDALGDLTGEWDHEMKTSAIADVEIDGPWSSARGGSSLRSLAIARG